MFHDKAADCSDRGNDLGGNGAAGTVKTKIFHTVGAVAALPTVTISVEELQRQVDVRTLPVTEIENLY